MLPFYHKLAGNPIKMITAKWLLYERSAILEWLQGILDFWVVIVIVIWVCIHKIRKPQRIKFYEKLGRIAEDYAKSENPEREPKAYYVDTRDRFFWWGKHHVVIHYGQVWNSYWVNIEPKNLAPINLEPYRLCVLSDSNIGPNGLTPINLESYTRCRLPDSNMDDLN